MKTAPSTDDITAWIFENKPMGITQSSFIQIVDIDPKPYSGHFNFLIEALNVPKMVLRFKGPEWGDAQGIVSEFAALQYVKAYDVGPKPHLLLENFFGETALLFEYLERTPENENLEYFERIARFIAKVSMIPVEENTFSSKPQVSFAKNIKTWRDRIQFIKTKEEVACATALEALTPQVEGLLQSFESLLKSTLGENIAFIFESAHCGHLVPVRNGFRFINWEKVSFGDPSYTLAVFLHSILQREDFKILYVRMREEFNRIFPIDKFESVLEHRLIERHIANLQYMLFSDLRKEGRLPANWLAHIENLQKFLDSPKLV